MESQSVNKGLVHGVAGTSSECPSKINWACCIICPTNSMRSNVWAGYQSFADILPEFQSANALPKHTMVDPAELDEGNGISATLAEHSAKWHKPCRLYVQCVSSFLTAHQHIIGHSVP